MDVAEKVSVSLAPEMARELRASVASGDYVSTSEAMRDALRVWKQKRREDEEYLVGVRDRIRRSVEDPRPNMSLSDVDRHLAAAFARAEKVGNAEPTR